MTEVAEPGADGEQPAPPGDAGKLPAEQKKVDAMKLIGVLIQKNDHTFFLKCTAYHMSLNRG